MIVHDPCDWLIDRLAAGTPCTALRFNDGEMAMMFRTRPEGEVLGTRENEARVSYELGDDLRRVLQDMARSDPTDVLVGCSWWHDREHPDTQRFRGFADLLGMLGRTNWCHEHWPLEGVVDGSTRRLVDALRGLDGRRPVYLVTGYKLAAAVRCLNGRAVAVPDHDAWAVRDEVYDACSAFCRGAADPVFVWAAGVGLKPTAWRLGREFPESSHVDVGHLFNGAMGLADYGWLERKDGPWYEPYFRDFAPYVRSFVQ